MPIITLIGKASRFEVAPPNPLSPRVYPYEKIALGIKKRARPSYTTYRPLRSLSLGRPTSSGTAGSAYKERAMNDWRLWAVAVLAVLLLAKCPA